MPGTRWHRYNLFLGDPTQAQESPYFAMAFSMAGNNPNACPRGGVESSSRPSHFAIRHRTKCCRSERPFYMLQA